MTLLSIVQMTCLACLAVVVILLVLAVPVLADELVGYNMAKTLQGHSPFPSCRLYGARELSVGHLLPLPEDMPGAGFVPAPGDDVETMG